MIRNRSSVDLAAKIYRHITGNPRGWTLAELILRTQLPYGRAKAGLMLLCRNRWMYQDGDRYWLHIK